MMIRAPFSRGSNIPWSGVRFPALIFIPLLERGILHLVPRATDLLPRVMHCVAVSSFYPPCTAQGGLYHISTPHGEESLHLLSPSPESQYDDIYGRYCLKTIVKLGRC